MVFSSIEFLFIFLPVFLIAQNYLPWRNATYAAFSLFFYFVGEGWFTAIIVVSVVVNYALGLVIEAQTQAHRRRLVLAAGVASNVLALLWFKYAAFFLEALPGVPRATVQAAASHLPLGISFLTFHAISYLVDVYRLEAKAERSLVNLSLYMLMFPQLIAGPILRFHTIADQLRRRVVTFRHAYFGFLLFCVGLGQKVLLADTLAHVADPLFARSETLSTLEAWLGSLAYSLQIFFDFCGYSNMALGLGWMTGFDLPQNFDYPYVSQSITEFWQRWHISLSRWFRDYLYIPLGGNRSGVARTYRNLLIVFLLCGLWHGAAWTFVVWGAYHGVWLVLERLGWGRVVERLPRPLRHVYAMLVVLIGWVLFRASSLSEAANILHMMFVPTKISIMALNDLLTEEEFLALCAGLLLCVPALPRLLSRATQLGAKQAFPKQLALGDYIRGCTAGAFVFGVAVTKVITGAYSTFIYFRF